MRWKIFDQLVAVTVFIGGISLIGLIVLMGYQVWGRYVINDTPTWAESLALLLIQMVSLPIAAIGLREDFHLSIDFIVDLLPLKLQRALKVLISLVLALFGIAMTWFSSDLVARTWDRNIPLIHLPQGVKYLPLVFCGILVVLFMIERFYGLLFARPTISGEN